ncbi:hypothetical protein J6590_101376, partial [Homalodisca vitripennis]
MQNAARSHASTTFAKRNVKRIVNTASMMQNAARSHASTTFAKRNVKRIVNTVLLPKIAALKIVSIIFVGDLNRAEKKAN